MTLTEQEIALGFSKVVCKCCGNEYKAHKMSNATSYSLEPNFGCSECQGLPKESTQEEMIKYFKLTNK